MQMISFVFFGFTTVVYLSLYLCGKINNFQKRNYIEKLILLVSSFIFTAYADITFALVLGIIVCSTWFCAKNRKLIPLGVLIPLVALSFFKYTDFFAESISALLGNDYTLLNLILPLGISFYSFSAVGYLIDVKRGKTEPRGFVDVALYLSFFPKLTSGPIQKSGDFFKQSDSERKIGWESFSAGIQIFVFGLFKKIVLADRLSVFVNQIYDTPEVFGSLTVLIATFAYSLQIYFDFSGYSDMAIGVARILGFKLPRNFNLPYVSHNVTELWKRWHITLSSWLQEYLYISLGGNRKGTMRTYINLILTMVIGGIWHGANWTYIIWGFLHGLALAVHKLWMKLTGSQKKKHNAFSSVISIMGTFLFTNFCWIFFRAESLSHAFEIISRIFSFEKGVEQPYFWFFVAVVCLMGSTLAAFIRSRKMKLSPKKPNDSMTEGFYPMLDLNKFWHLVAFFIFCGLIVCLAYTGGSPFIYGNY